MWYLSGVVPGPAESALSTHVLSRVYTALTERGEPLTEVSRVCRAKHELSEGAGLLPMLALQEPPLKRLQQQRDDNGGPHQLVECESMLDQWLPETVRDEWMHSITF